MGLSLLGIGSMVGDVASVLFTQGRNIGGIIPNVVIEEHHTDKLEITRHPIQQGAAITDHAYKLPAELSMHVAWSNSTAAGLLSQIVGGTLFSGATNSMNDLYDQFLSLQESRIPFSVVTGKRSYNNMLISSINQTTNADTENSLVLTIDMTQIIIVQTATSTLPPSAVQAFPQSTNSTTNTGTANPTTPSVSQSALSALFGGQSGGKYALP